VVSRGKNKPSSRPPRILRDHRGKCSKVIHRIPSTEKSNELYVDVKYAYDLPSSAIERLAMKGVAGGLDREPMPN